MSNGSGLPGLLTPRLTSPRSQHLFAWEADSLGLNALTGQAATFARAGQAGLVADVLGRGRRPVHSAPRYEMVDLDGDGIRETRGLLIEGATTNLLPDSEDFSTWAVIGTPVLTSGKPDPLGGTAAFLIADDDGAAQEYVTKTIAANTFTDAQAVAFAVFWAPGPNQNANGSRLWLRDTTASADRLLASIVPGATPGARPTLNVSTGVPIGIDGPWLGPDNQKFWRILVQSTAVTRANAHAARILPAGAAADTGDAYFFGAMLVDSPRMPSYWRTSGGTGAGTAETLSYPFAPLPQPMTLYARFVARGGGLVGVVRLAQIGSNAGARLYLQEDATGFRVGYRGASSLVQPLAAIVPSYGDLVEVLGTISNGPDGANTAIVRARINGAEASGQSLIGNVLPAAWGAATITIGTDSAGGSFDGGALVAVRAAAGIRSIDEMRAR